MGKNMLVVYNIVISILGIILSPVILVLFALKPKLRAGFWQKIGCYPELSKDKPVVWFHAVSVGEVNAVEGLIKKFREEFKDYNIVLSTVTRTGQQVATNKLSKTVDNIIYFPYDFIFSVKSAINAINPKAVIIAETEIWPNFSCEAGKKNIPLILVNGRISPTSYRNYRKFRFFFREVLRNYTSVLMQTREDRNRIIEIGANAERTEIMGNLKFDITGVLSSNEINNLRDSLQIGVNKLLIAGSTHLGEDETVLKAFKNLKSVIPDIKLMIVPRHPERHNQVVKLLSESGFNWGRRSFKDDFSRNDIILLDTMGELGKMYAASYLAFIGGSFSGTGGHNPLEPAIYGVPAISGPTVFNFKDIYTYMTASKAAKIVQSEHDLYSAFFELLTDTDKYNAMSLACKEIFETNKGALNFTINRFKELIK